MLEKNQWVKTIYEVENGKSGNCDVKTGSHRYPSTGYPDAWVDGFEVIEYVQRQRLPTRIIALTAFDEEAMIFNLLRADVAGIIFKKTTHQQEILYGDNYRVGR